jgi:hypothetical protein
MHRRLPVSVLSLAIVLCIGLGAAWPYFQSPGLPAQTDAELHIYRTAELGYSLEAGNPYPRWAPDFFHGYGYPIFNYYAPLTYHLSHWLTMGHPERAAEGARLLFILSLVVGALGAFELGKLFGGRGGGIAGALVFSCAPYILLINPHLRGDLAESLALAFVPWALWAWELVWRRGGAPRILAAVVATSVVFLSHNLTGLTIVALIGGLSLWRWLLLADGARMAQAVMTAVIFVLLTSFFWLPFLAERRYVRLDVAGDGHYDFRNHFVLPQDLFSLVLPLDGRASAPDIRMTTGLVPVLLALGGTLYAAYQRRFKDIGFYVVGSGLLLWLILPIGRPLWELLPGLYYYQFPWRFLGPVAALLVPPVAALGALPRPRRDGAHRSALLTPAILAMVAAGVLASALPGMSALSWEPGLGFITQEDIIAAELDGRWRGTTSTNDFVPTSVEMIPGPQESVIASFRQPPVDRVNRHTLPDGAVVTVVPDLPWVNRLSVTANEAFHLRLYLFDFPGWQAYVDGTPVPIEIAHPEGFITVAVPQGRHEVVVRFESTPIRDLAWGLSGLGVAALLGTMAYLSQRERRSTASDLARPTRRPPDPPRPERVRAGHEVRAVAAIGSIVIAVGLLKATVFDPQAWFGVTSSLHAPLPADFQQQAGFGGDISLLAYDLSSENVLPGDAMEITLYWIAEHPITATYQSFVHLVYPEGQIRSQSDHLNPGGFPTNLWPTDRYIVDRHRLTIPDDAETGTYLVSIGLFTLDTHLRVPVVAAQCGHRLDSVILCQGIYVER